MEFAVFRQEWNTLMAGNWWDAYPVAGKSGVAPNPIAVRKAVADINQSGANTNRSNTSAAVDAAGIPFVAPKAQADIRKTGLEADKLNRLNGNDSAVRAKALAQFGSGQQLERILTSLKGQYAKGPGATHGIAGLMDLLPTPGNKAFDTTGREAQALLRNALGLTGGEANTMAEMQANLGGYIPEASNYDAQNEKIFEGMAAVRDNARNLATQTLGGTPDANGNVTPLQGNDAVFRQAMEEAKPGIYADYARRHKGASADPVWPKLLGIGRSAFDKKLQGGSGNKSIHFNDLPER